MKAIAGPKLTVRRSAEKSGIPYTFVASLCFGSYYGRSLGQDRFGPAPRDGKLLVLGDGNAKAVFNDDVDIGIFTIKAAGDPRAANKNLLIIPKEKVASQNELIALWEKKIGHNRENELLDKEGVVKSFEELNFPRNIYRTIKYSNFVKGQLPNLQMDHSKDVEATALYPDVKYSTLDEFLNLFV